MNIRRKNEKKKTIEKEGRRMLDVEKLKFKLCLLLARVYHLEISSPSTYIFLTSFPLFH